MKIIFFVNFRHFSTPPKSWKIANFSQTWTIKTVSEDFKTVWKTSIALGLKKRVWLNQHNFLQKPTKKRCFTLQIKVVGYEKYYFHFHFLEKCVAVWVKCDWTFLRFWGVNSTSKEKIWLSWIDFPKTRNENETNFGGSKISNNTCGLWSVQHVRDVMIFT